MKRFLLMAAIVGGLTLGGFGFASTAKADGWRHGYGWHGGYRGYGYGYGGWRGGYYRPYRPYVAPGVFVAGPRFGIGIGTGYYAAPYAAYGVGPYGYPGCGW